MNDRSDELHRPQESVQAGSFATLPMHLRRWTVALGGCWIAEKRQPNGYSYSTSVKGKKGSQYKLIWEHLNGPVPEGLELDHLCDNGPGGCVNPYHLKAVSHRENVLRSPTHPMAQKARQTHCKHGHEFTPENTLWWGKVGQPKATRRCRTCQIEGNKRTRAKHRDKYLAQQRAAYHAKRRAS